MIIAAILNLPLPYFIIVELWCKDLGYEEYMEHCQFYGCEPIEEKLYQVYCNALQEEYLCTTPELDHATSLKQSLLP